MRSLPRLFSLFLLCLLLQACAAGARPEKMVALPTEDSSISKSHKYFQAIALNDVSGGKETNPMLLSKVSNSAFQKALEDSLEAHNLLSKNGNAKYNLSPEILALEQPVMGFSFTVDSVVRYDLQKASSKKTVFNETIKAAGTATMGDAFVGTERLRMANENSIKNNLQQFIDKLTGK